MSWSQDSCYLLDDDGYAFGETDEEWQAEHIVRDHNGDAALRASHVELLAACDTTMRDHRVNLTALLPKTCRLVVDAIANARKVTP